MYNSTTDAIGRLVTLDYLGKRGFLIEILGESDVELSVRIDDIEEAISLYNSILEGALRVALKNAEVE